MSEDFVKIHVRYRADGDGPAGESPWAEPVDATDGGGTFRLQNDLFFTPLRHGDLVRCELDADSLYQLVAVEALMPGVLYGFEHPRDTEHIVRPALEANIAAGFEVNRVADGFAEVFVPGASADAPLALPQIPSAWELVERLDAFGRLAQAERDIDFELNHTPVMNVGPIDYWSADDSAWAELGADDPEVLAAIQSLAADDPRVLATISAGRHRDVLTFMERLNAADPRELPELDRPLLVDPTTD